MGHITLTIYNTLDESTTEIIPIGDFGFGGRHNASKVCFTLLKNPDQDYKDQLLSSVNASV